MNRREFLRSLVVSSVLVAISIVGLEEMANLARTSQQQIVNQIPTQSATQTQQNTSSTGSSTTGQQQSTISAPAGYVFIAQLSALGGLSYAYFTHPDHGSSIFVNINGQWKAFSSTCTHRPCTVQYQGSSIYCPCHGGTFSPNNGSVTGGPPPSPLPEYGVSIINDNVYVSANRIN
jgi:Rieske Fe-S protein